MLALENKSHGQIEFVIADVNTPEGSDLARQYDVYPIPRFIILDAKGNIAYSEIGPQPREKLDSYIAEVINRK